MGHNQVNTMCFEGILSADPDIKTLPSGVVVANMKVENHRFFMQGDTKHEITSAVEVEAFNTPAKEMSKYIKGQAIRIEGNLTTQKWTDKNSKNHTKQVMRAKSITGIEKEAWDKRQNQENSIEIEGNLVKNPEIKTLSNQTKLVKIDLASNRFWKPHDWKEGDPWSKETTFVKIDAWGKLADELEKTEKGQPVKITGTVENNNWTANGIDHRDIVIKANRVQILEREQKQERVQDKTREQGEDFNYEF